MTCHLIADTDDKPSPPTSSLSGSLVSSIHKLKDADNTDGGFFIWGDLSAKVEGQYRLQFTLFELRFPEMVYLTYVVSKPFIVHPPKTFPGMSESTFLTRSFSDQGVRLRLRKDSRSMTNRKRNAAAAAEHHSGHMRLRAQEEEHRRRSQQMAAMRQNSYAETMSPIDGPGSHHRQPFGGPPGAPTGLGMYSAPPPDPRRDMPPLGPYGHHAAPGSHGHHAAASSHHYGGTSDPVVKRQRTSGGGDDSPAQWASDLPQYPTPTSVDDGSARRPESATHGQGGTWTPTMPYTTASPVFSLPPTTAPSPGMHGGATALPAPSPGGMAPHHAHQQHPHAHHQQPPHAGMPGMPSASPTMSPHHHAGPPAPQGSNGVMAAAGGPYNPYGAMPQPSPYGQHDARRMPAPGEIPPNFNF